MEVKALEFYKNGYMKGAFAFGGSENNPYKEEILEASLQGYIINTGSEVILVDTGMPMETPDFDGKPGQMLYTGEKVNNFVDALKVAGYEPNDIDKVVITHKHPDHTGELRLFSNAKIYISEVEANAMGLEGENIVKVKFESGCYKNFDKSEKIAEGIYMLPAVGHTKGNSILVVEDKELSFMLHGDITYTDKALKENMLSMVFEDKEEAAKTLNIIREFIRNNKTIYLGTHSPESLKSLSDRRLMEI